MGFLSAIFKVFFPSGSRSTKPEKSERDYDLEEWERNKKLLTKAMTETLELTSFSYDTKSKFLKQIDTYLSKQESNEKYTLFDLLYPIVKDTDWTWQEWEYWAPICLSKRIATRGMHKTCRPWADVLDIEAERAKYTVNGFVERHTIKDIQARLSAIKEDVPAFKRKNQLSEYLESNEPLFTQILNDEIKEKWNKKRHNNGHTKEAEFQLLCETIADRYYDLSEIADARECGPCKFEITFDDEPEDEALYKLGKKKDAPWKGKYLPNVPGLSFMREDV